MDSQLYVWARKQEISRELARRALLLEASRLPANGKATATQSEGSPILRALRRVTHNPLRIGAGRLSGQATRQTDANRCPAVEEAARRDIMRRTEEYARGTAPTREEAMQQNGNGRTWRWHVEPGMEDAFQDLLGWMLSGQRNAEIELAKSPPPGASVPPETQPAPEPQPTGWGRKQAPAPI